MIPLLYTMHERLEFTEQTLPILFKNTPGKVFFMLIDTSLTKSTSKYLKKNLKKIAKNKQYLFVRKPNLTISEAMAYFFDFFRDYNFQYAAKVDNDTLVPKNWLLDLHKVAKKHSIDILQAKHYIMNYSVKNWDEWTLTMEKKENGRNFLYFNHFVGGSGVVFHKKTMRTFNGGEYKHTRLMGWTQFQAQNKQWKKAFYDGVYVDLLDMQGDNNLIFSLYPEYYIFTGRNKPPKNINVNREKLIKQKVENHITKCTSPEKESIIKQMPKQEMYKIVSPANFKPTEYIPHGEFRYFKEIPYWAKNNPSFVIIKTEVYIPPVSVKTEEKLKDKAEKEGKQVRKCQYCNYQTLSLKRLKTHIEKKHTSKK